MFTFPIYLDNNATTACDPRVLEVMIPYFTHNFGNPSSRYHLRGWEAQEAVEIARDQVASLIGANANEIFFTSGATESANLAITGSFQFPQAKGRHILTTQTEHKAVLDACYQVEEKGGKVSYLSVNTEGILEEAVLRNAIQDQTFLLSVIFANNETGVVQNMALLGKIAKENKILFFTDATQAVGKIPVKVKDLGIDLMAFTAHKIYGPKGVGALYIRNQLHPIPISPVMHGGGQEKGLRSGTLNVPGIVGFGKACDLCRLEMEEEGARLHKLRNRLENGILSFGRGLVNGNVGQRIPHTTNLSFPDMDIEKWIHRINKNLALSTGSACTSARLEPSHVLIAMGMSPARALNALRFGLGRFTTEEEIQFTLGIIQENLPSE